MRYDMKYVMYILTNEHTTHPKVLCSNIYIYIMFEYRKCGHVTIILTAITYFQKIYNCTVVFSIYI